MKIVMLDNMASNDTHFADFNDNISDELRHAVIDYVDAKYLLDSLVLKRGGYRLARKLSNDGYGPLEGSSFYQMTFPFVPVWQAVGDSFSARVPTGQVVGSSWRWSPKSVAPAERESLLDKLSEPQNADAGYYGRADYMWIRPLGLILAHEGKNRVALFREMKCATIPAHVQAYDYPAAERMTLYELTINDRPAYWVVLDGVLVERLEHPEWVLAILKLYGVIQAKRWPSEFPSVQDVLAAFNLSPKQAGFPNKTIVNLEKLAKDKSDQEEMVVCSILDLQSVRLRRRFWLSVLGGGASQCRRGRLFARDLVHCKNDCRRWVWGGSWRLNDFCATLFSGATCVQE